MLHVVNTTVSHIVESILHVHVCIEKVSDVAFLHEGDMFLL